MKGAARWVPLVVTAVVLLAGLIYVWPTEPNVSQLDETETATATSEPKPGTSTTTEDESDDEDTWSRVLDDRTLTLLRFGLVVFGAFAIGGVVQRAFLGEYGFKTPILELPDRAASKGDVGDLAIDMREELDGLRKQVRTDLGRAASAERLLQLEGVVDELIELVDNLLPQIQSDEEGPDNE